MKKQNYLIIAILAILIFNLSLNLKSQVAVNTSGEAANTSAMLDVSSTEKGILIPRMSLAQRNLIDSPENGLLIYQNDNTPGFYYYNGTAWVVVGDGATTINSLADGKTDPYSLFLGSGTGAADDGGNNRNTAIGISAYNSSVDGYANTAFGNETLKLNTTGTHNAAFGTQALTSNLTGIENTALGTNTGFNVTGSGNVLIGSNVAFSQTAISNKLFIDNENTETPLIYGEFDNDLLRVYGTLDINNAYQLPTSDGTSGQTLKTNGSGSLSWTNDIGSTRINELSDGISDSATSVFLGYGAGVVDDGNNYNTSIGINSLNANTSGVGNIAIGESSLKENTTGNWNCAVGKGSLLTNTSGTNNTAFGAATMLVNSTGDYNVAIGRSSLGFNPEGEHNTAVGAYAGYNSIGDGNIFLGYYAGNNETGSNTLYIENSESTSPLVYGEFDNNLLRINGKLQINSPWLEFNNSGYSIYIGDSAGENHSGNLYNTAVGYHVMKVVTTGLYNTSVGANSLEDNTTGSNNTSVGDSAMNLNTTGSENVAYGKGALYSNISGSGNVAIGSKAGYYEIYSNKLYIDNSDTIAPLIYGEFNNDLLRVNGKLQINSPWLEFENSGYSVYIGKDAGEGHSGIMYNTAVGYHGLKYNTSGKGNTSCGAFALEANQTGFSNTALGYNAGLNSDGDDNVFLGYATGHNSTGDLNVFIGSKAGYHETGSNKLYIENTENSTPLIYGEFDNNLVKINGDLTVTGDLVFSGGIGQIDALVDAICDSSSLFLGPGSGIADDGSANENVGVGISSLNAVTSGHHNIAVGNSALSSLTTGYDNVAIGVNAGSGSTGNANIFVGANAGVNETGNNKLIIANSDDTSPLIYGEFDNNLLRINGTLDINNAYQLPTNDGSANEVLTTDGNGNLSWVDENTLDIDYINNLEDGKAGGLSVFLGENAGSADDGTSNMNSSIGYASLQNNNTGDHNTAIGYNGLNNTTTGSRNTAIGALALESNQTGFFNTAIGVEAGINSVGDANIFIGYSTGFNADGDSNVFLGNKAGYYESGSNKLYIENTDISNPLIYGEFNNNLVRINGDLEVTGNLLLTRSVDDLTDGISNTSSIFLGQGAGVNDDGTTNQNVGLGINSLNAITSGVENTSLGYEALKLSSTGHHNLAVGSGALSSLITGYDNVALGVNAGSNSTGNANIFIGANAGANATGNNKLFIANSDDPDPLIYGEFDNGLVRIYGDFEVMTPNNCTKFGVDALEFNTTGTYNTAIGFESLYGNNSGSQNVALGGYALTSNETGSQNTAVGYNAGTNNSGYSNTTSIGYNTITGASDEVHIGNTSVGWIGGQVGWGTYSDGRFKRNVQENVPGLEFILKLKPVSYNWDIHKLDAFIGATEGTESSAHMREARRQQEAKVYTGFLAQEVEQAANQIGYNFSGVETPPNDGTPYSLRYAEFVVPLVKAVQEQQDMIELLKEQNKALWKEIEALKKK